MSSTSADHRRAGFDRDLSVFARPTGDAVRPPTNMSAGPYAPTVLSALTGLPVRTAASSLGRSPHSPFPDFDLGRRRSFHRAMAIAKFDHVRRRPFEKKLNLSPARCAIEHGATRGDCRERLYSPLTAPSHTPTDSSAGLNLPTDWSAGSTERQPSSEVKRAPRHPIPPFVDTSISP